MGNTERGTAVNAEEFLAATIEDLRTREGWSYAELSQRMGEAGCPIERSSLQKIERGQPRRKITVNELVAFSRVFNVEIPELLVSPSYKTEQMFLRDLEDGPRLTSEAWQAKSRQRGLVHRVAGACVDMEDGHLREEALRKTAAALEGATEYNDQMKHMFLEEVLSVIDAFKEEEGGE